MVNKGKEGTPNSSSKSCDTVTQSANPSTWYLSGIVNSWYSLIWWIFVECLPPLLQPTRSRPAMCLFKHRWESEGAKGNTKQHLQKYLAVAVHKQTLEGWPPLQEILNLWENRQSKCLGSVRCGWTGKLLVSFGVPACWNTGVGSSRLWRTEQQQSSSLDGW